MSDIKNMQIGQLVDFVISYNERQETAQKQESKPKKRLATQAEIDAFLG